MQDIITEITPLSEKDCLYLADRHKEQFTYPLHRHDEYELNIIKNCNGVRRIVGDSVEVLGDFDLVIVGNGIEHTWEQYECSNKDIREITIQFSKNLFGENFLSKTQITSIRKLLEMSADGVAFPREVAISCYERIEYLSKIKSGFHQMLEFMAILHELAEQCEYHKLSSSAFSSNPPSVNSRRIFKIQKYINEHFRDVITLEELASLVAMAPNSLCRFFKAHTGRSVSEYLIDIRLGHAIRLLVDTTISIAEICYGCGFNNISNFNRIFKKRKQKTPKEFRELYQRHKIAM